MADMGATLPLLMAHHRRMLALGDFPILVGFIDVVSLRHLLIESEKNPAFRKNVDV